VERAGYVEELVLERRTEVTITDPAVLRRELMEIHNHGYAVSDGEYMPGLQGIAVVFRDASGEAVGAVGISAQSFEPPTYEAIEKHIGPLMMAGRDITARLAVWERKYGGDTSGA
jgi:DNA-binding IclR family transcriptional regulator